MPCERSSFALEKYVEPVYYLEFAGKIIKTV